MILISVLSIIVVLLLVFAVWKDNNQNPVNLLIGKNKDDIIRITMNDTLRGLFNKVEEEIQEFHIPTRKNIKSYGTYKTDALYSEDGRYEADYNKAIIFDRLLVYLENIAGDKSMKFAYIVDNFNIVFLGEIPFEYIYLHNDAKMYMSCDDSIGINGIMENEPHTYRKNVFLRSVNFTSYGYCFTGQKNALVQEGFLDQMIYYKHPKKENVYIKIDHRCME